MTSTAFDQFAVCTPEEEELFQEAQARKDAEMIQAQCDRQAEVLSVRAMSQLTYPHFLNGNLCPSQFGSVIYAAIKAGRIPGVVLGGGHE